MHVSWKYRLFEKTPRSPAKDIIFGSDRSAISKFLPECLSEEVRCMYGTESDSMLAVKVMQGLLFISVYS